jgi:predicted methyltransferase
VTARSVPIALAAGLALALPAVPAPTPAETHGEAEERLREAIASPERAAENRARDAHRNPFETLRFFGIAPDMHVLELWPGRGWYTEILGPFLAEKGKLTVTNADPEGPQDQYVHRMAREFATWLSDERERLGLVEVITVAPPERLHLGPDAAYDAILTFRNNHSWIRGGYHEAIYAEIFRVLKPGGMLGVVQHRAPEGADAAVSAENGYVPEAFVIEAAGRAGLELAGRSEVNANPKDPKDHPGGVWSLPPSYRLGDEDRAVYEAIGESDRMTLKFVKPAAAAPAK